MNKAFLCAVLLFAGAFALQWQGWRLDAQQAQVAEEVHRLKQQNAAQTAKIDRLKTWLDELKGDSEGLLEELVREKLFMIKPGEVYILPQSESR